MQEKIFSIQQKEAEAMVEADADLARSIIMDSMMAGPLFGGAGAVLNISAAPPPDPGTAAASTPSFRFHVVEMLGEDRRMVEIIDDQPPMQRRRRMEEPYLLPVNLVVYLYSGEGGSDRHRHITTLECPMLNIDNITYAMRERQVLDNFIANITSCVSERSKKLITRRPRDRLGVHSVPSKFPLVEAWTPAKFKIKPELLAGCLPRQHNCLQRGRVHPLHDPHQIHGICKPPPWKHGTAAQHTHHQHGNLPGPGGQKWTGLHRLWR